MSADSKKVVLIAICGNAMLTVLKFTVAVPTHSAAMMNEAIHSLMDTLNQLFLLMGLKSGSRPADRRYAFGHGQKKYLWNLWSAIGLFSIGCGLGLSHAWHAWQESHNTAEQVTVKSTLFGSIDPLALAMGVLLIALLVESWVLKVAWREFAQRARMNGHQNALSYLSQSDDPTLVAVLLEDAVAVIGVLLAAIGIALTHATGIVLWDIGFSVVIAVMLGITAVFLGMINMRFLSDVRDQEAEEAFRLIVDAHKEIERYHDLRSIVIDDRNTVLVAEIELKEESILSALRERITQLRAESSVGITDLDSGESGQVEFLSDRALVQATLERTEQIIDELELRLREQCPRVSHVTIEVEGIVENHPVDKPDGQNCDGVDNLGK